MTVLEEVGAFLAAAGLGVIGADLFLGKLPNDPPACGAVYEYGGFAPEGQFGASGIRHETPAIQVVFRGEPHDYAGPRAKAKTAFVALTNVETQSLSGTFYHWIHAQQSPFLLQRDDAERTLIACNYLCEKEPSA
jgi:hypothetical protein